MHPACPNKKENHLQNSLLRRTQFWVRKSFSKPASLKRASLVLHSYPLYTEISYFFCISFLIGQTPTKMQQEPTNTLNVNSFADLWKLNLRYSSNLSARRHTTWATSTTKVAMFPSFLPISDPPTHHAGFLPVDPINIADFFHQWNLVLSGSWSLVCIWLRLLFCCWFWQSDDIQIWLAVSRFVACLCDAFMIANSNLFWKMRDEHPFPSCWTAWKRMMRRPTQHEELSWRADLICLPGMDPSGALVLKGWSPLCCYSNRSFPSALERCELSDITKATAAP